MTAQQPRRYGDTVIFPASLDPDAVSVVQRLLDAGFEAYLVGGCVRDLLLGHIPKDFDISTEARPRQIRRVFRNCRVIGRRFKLAHVHFGPKIIEVATFRRTPDESAEASDDADDLLIVRDNIFGTAEEDALRRDFTCNALLYDVRSDEVVDWVGGVTDLQEHTLRAIGDAQVRLAEDPVRMLRAVKFASRLELRLDDEMDAALRDAAPLVRRSAPARVIEEIYRLLSCGKAAGVLTMLLEYGLFEPLLPELFPYWKDRAKGLVAVGSVLDIIDGGQRRVSNAFFLTALCLEPWRASLEEAPGADATLRADEFLRPLAVRMSLPRRDVSMAKQMLVNQLRLQRPGRRRRFRMSEFLSRASTADAVQLLHLAARSGHADPELHALWAQRLATHSVQRGLAPPSPAPARRPRRGSAQPAKEPVEAPAGARRRSRPGRGRPASARPEPTAAATPDPAPRPPPSEPSPPPGRGLMARLRSLLSRWKEQGEERAASATVQPEPTAAPGTDAERAGGEGEQPRRRRRKRRRRRSGATSTTGPKQESGAAAGKPPAKDSAGGRRRRRRSGTKAGGSSSSSRSRSERDGSGQASGPARRRRRGDRSRSSAPTSGRPDGDRATPPPSRPSGPGQRAPEDVEDLFDW